MNNVPIVALPRTKRRLSDKATELAAISTELMELGSLGGASEVRLVQRQAELNRRLDELVYDLYEVKEKDVALIERGVRDRA